MIQGREGIALGILTVAAFFGCFAIVQIASEPSAYDYQAKDAKSTASGQQLAKDGVDAKIRRPPADQSICRHAKTEKEYELCQSWRAADGAKEAAGIAWWQLFVSIGGLVGLIYTVRHTKRAADAARMAAEVAERALFDLEQPQVFADVVSAGVTLVAGRFTTLGVKQFRYRFRNFGRTPARMVCITLQYPIVPQPNMPPPIVDATPPDRTFPTGIIVAESSPYSEPENLRAHYGYGGLFDAGRTPTTHRLFFLGRSQYSSIFDQTFTVGFCFVFDPTYERWVQTGDNQNYNYTRKEPKAP